VKNGGDDSLIDSHDGLDQAQTTNTSEQQFEELFDEPQSRRSAKIFRRKLWKKGKFITVANTHVGNSLVLYRRSDRTIQPAQIHEIHAYNDPQGNELECTLVVRDLLPLPDGVKDPLQTFPDFPARTYSSCYGESRKSIYLSQLVSHYARWVLPCDIAFILDLSQVITRFLVSTR
jgi:hypothetical protein